MTRSPNFMARRQLRRAVPVLPPMWVLGIVSCLQLWKYEVLTVRTQFNFTQRNEFAMTDAPACLPVSASPWPSLVLM